MEERKIQIIEGCANALATSKAPDGKTPSTFAMYVDDKLKQMDTRSRTLTEKRIIYILFEAEMETTCVPPVQAQYSSGTPQTQNFWMGLQYTAITNVEGTYV